MRGALRLIKVFSVPDQIENGACGGIQLQTAVSTVPAATNGHISLYKIYQRMEKNAGLRGFQFIETHPQSKFHLVAPYGCFIEKVCVHGSARKAIHSHVLDGLAGRGVHGVIIPLKRGIRNAHAPFLAGFTFSRAEDAFHLVFGISEAQCLQNVQDAMAYNTAQ